MLKATPSAGLQAMPFPQGGQMMISSNIMRLVMLMVNMMMLVVGEYYDDVENEEECVNDIWWVEHPAASITPLLLKILDWEISDHVFRNVFPGYREVMVLENTHPMLGTCGTLSWQLVEINLRLIVMWRYDGLMLLVMTMTFSPVSPSTSTSATPTMQ